MATPLEAWVEQAAALTRPDRIVWCDGTAAERERLVREMVADGTLLELNGKTYPNSHLHRSDPRDVARTEKVTFICSRKQEDAGPTNNWMAPEDAKQRVRPLFEEAMKGRTMYVAPYVMGPVESPYARLGVELTDSAYVAVSMGVMTRMGRVALDLLGRSDDFVPGLHSMGDLNPERRFVLHFPEERLIWSVGSGYGGNALLGKKCFALRIASSIARSEGWMAEHMLILGLEDPGGRVTYMAAAFPSACGKTNMAMMVSALANEGYRVWTVGDDIAWLHPGADGYLYAVNPEAGFFGVAPGTNEETNPNVMAAVHRNTIFTNVACTREGEPWWEGLTPRPPNGLIDWKGQPWTPESGAAAHPNSRYTVPARQSPSISPRWEDPAGVPISAFIFGGRRARLAPLVYEALNWQHGVYVAATMASETTAAATGAVGVVRRDPMAMLPFCGYNMADYWRHWMEMGSRVAYPPRIFHVNWFRKGADGRLLWPGYGQNVRVLKWMLDRMDGKAGARETPIGLTPTPESLELDDLRLPDETVEALLRVDPADWTTELDDIGAFFRKFGPALPQELQEEYEQTSRRLNHVAVSGR
ncbi:MAG TPA: phosphoenolpyruvate carboxykinase (GTP) [Candidatus Acidoferrales bacterium]|nr:phosphoenolpyruvate carboxykinase (GTP) [Candidatus Acidoferrales bacterium]